jgi:hypothetical protein
MLYGIENTFMREKDYLSLDKLESKIIKTSLQLSKYHSSTLLKLALKIKPIETIITVRILKFMVELMNNELCRNIRLISNQLGYIQEIKNTEMNDNGIFEIDI